jgi:hypothetical protein
MKFLLVLLMTSTVTYAQDDRAEFRALLEKITAPVECTELRVEHDTRKVQYTLSTTQGTDYDSEFYLNFLEENASPWKAFIAYEDFNGTPMGSLEKKSIDEKTTHFVHTFYGYYPSTLTLTASNGIARKLKYETTIPLGYRILILNCDLK